MNLERITYFTRETIVSALEHERVIGPLSYANIQILPGIVNGKVSVENITNGQLVLFQRNFPEKLDDYVKVLRAAKSLSKPVVYDLDDLLINLPESHPDRISGYFAQALLPILRALVDADLVTVTTPRIKEAISGYNNNIVVLPNLFDEALWKFKSPKHSTSQEVVKIGYMGGDSHKADLEMLLPVLLELSKEVKEKIQFNFYGTRPPGLLEDSENIEWKPTQTYDYSQFAADFQGFEADIVIAPLEDNVFNRCKSGIKYLEYSALGVPGVYSNLPPYSEIISNGENGLLATSLENWKQYLLHLINNPEARLKIAQKAQLDVQNNWLMRKKSNQWRTEYTRLFEAGPTLSKVESVPVTLLNTISDQLFKYHEEMGDRLNAAAMMLPGSQPKFSTLNQKLKAIQSKIQFQADELEKNKNTIVVTNYQLESKKHDLDEIYKSKAWKVAMFLRNARVKILPPDSKLFLVARRIYRAYKLTKQPRFKNDKSVRNSSSPMISVVIPIYDRTQVLVKSIESILSQTYQNFELLLVCDGSPNETLEIVRKYEKTSPKVRAFYFKNNSGNAVRGRNKGIMEARGQYLAFQDSDDVAEFNRLQDSLDAIEKYNADVVYGAWRALVDGSREIGIKDGEVFFSPDCDLEMLKRICVPCQSTVMARVEALRKVGGLKAKMRYREDHELWVRLAYNGYKFKAVEKMLTNLRLHKNNLEITYKDSDSYWYNLMLDEYMHISPMRPKIGYVIPGTGISGGIAVVCEHVNRLLKRGYDISLITEDNSNTIPWYPNQMVEVIPLKDAANNYGILVATGWSTAYSVSSLQAVRKFYFVQSDERRFYSEKDPVVQKVLKTYEMDFEFLTEAKWIQKWLKAEYSKDAVYVPNGINEEIIYPDTPLIEKGQKLRVLIEGPIDIPFKGIAEAAEAVKNLDCEVWMVSSSGSPRPEWKVDQFFHKVPFGMMRRIYSSCDILLKMSRVEGFFGPPMEMMACGGAVVVSKVTGYDEYIIDGYNALVVDMGDVQGAKQAVKQLLDDDLLRATLIENGKKTASEWKWDPTIDKLESVFSSTKEQ